MYLLWIPKGRVFFWVLEFLLAWAKREKKKINPGNHPSRTSDQLSNEDLDPVLVSAHLSSEADRKQKTHFHDCSALATAVIIILLFLY